MRRQHSAQYRRAVNQRRLRALAVLALALVCLVPLAVHSSRATAGPLGSITGTITNSAGAPVVNATVEIFIPGCNFATTPDSAVTDASGGYTISNVPDGTYTVEILPPSTFPSPQFYENPSPATVGTPAPTTVTISGGSNATGISDSLLDFGTITGQVTNSATGAPLQNIQVQASGPGSGSATTLVNGTYTIGSLKPGSYTVSFDDSANHAFISQSLSNINVSSGQTTPNVNAAMVLGGSLSGTVVPPPGVSAQNILAEAFSTTTSFKSFTFQTDAAGAYSITGLPTDSYKIEFFEFQVIPTQWFGTTGGQVDKAKATTVTVTAPATTPEGQVQLVAGGSIAGTVNGPNGPVNGVLVESFNATPGIAGFNTASSGPPPAAGQFTLNALPADTYRVDFNDFTSSDDLLPQSVSGVTVTNGKQATANVTLVKGGTITGTLFVNGQPQAGAFVSAQVVPTSSAPGTFAFTNTASDGTYTLQPLATGNYEVSYFVFGQTFFYKDTSSQSSETLVPVTVGQTSPGIDEHVTVAACATTTALAAAPNPSTSGQSVTFTATVARGSGGGTPTGQITFLDGSTVIGTGAVASGVATFTTTSLTPGTHPITASYSGDSANSASTSSVLNQVVNGSGTTTTTTTTPGTTTTTTTTTGATTTTTATPGTTTTSTITTGTTRPTGGTVAPAPTTAPTTTVTSSPSTSTPAASSTVVLVLVPGSTVPASTSTVPLTTTTPPTTALPVTVPPVPQILPTVLPTTTLAPTTTTTEPPTTTTTTAAPAPGAVKLDKPSGEAGGDSVVKGSGCPPGPVELFLEGQKVGSTTAGPDGTFEAHLQIPLVSVGLHDVVVHCSGVTLTTQIAVVVSTASPAAAANAVLAAMLGFFVLIGLAFFLARPQSGTTLSAVYRPPPDPEEGW